MNAELSEAVVRRCLELGAREFVVCSGSRNSDLVLCLWQNRARVKIWGHFEERSAAFFALGRVRASAKPMAVITTSGTAVAELLPAAIEAHYQALPLLLVTADRPVCFRESGAPQAIQQEKLFGLYAEWAGDITVPEEAAKVGGDWKRRRPLHLNVCFEEPTISSPRFLAECVPLILGSEPQDNESAKILAEFLKMPGPLVSVLGCLNGDASSQHAPIITFLLRLGAPVLAEATSGLREEKELAHLLLEGSERCMARLNYRRVLRIGGVPSGRFWRDLENRPDISVLSLTERPFPGLARPSEWIVASPARILANTLPGPQDGPDDWAFVSHGLGQKRDELLDSFPLSEPAYVRRISEWIGPSARVFLGNSLPIREWNLAARPRTPIQVWANRGANGIDGALSTFLGLAADGEESWGIFGDLTAMYDLVAPSLLPEIASLPLRIVIINNGGGRIFGRLPHLQSAPEAARRLIENRHAIRFDSWAAMWGLPYHRVETNEALPPSACVLEVLPDPEQTAAFWSAWQAN